MERINAIRDSTWKDSRKVMYSSCEDCDEDVVVDFNVEDSAVEGSQSGEDDSISDGDDTPQEGISAPDANVPAPDEEVPVQNEVASVPTEGMPDFSAPDAEVPPPSPKRFLCHSCKEEAAARRLQCTVCGDNFKALPSDDAYTAEKPICGQCVWANIGRDERYCSNCGEILKFHMLPHHWNEFEDDEVPLCPKCRLESMNEDESESLEGIDVSGTADLVRTR